MSAQKKAHNRRAYLFRASAATLAILVGIPEVTKAENSQKECQHVGGGILTNFLLPNQCAGPTNLCSDGIATGDFKGSVGVQVLSVTGSVYTVHHHWVTDSGDSIFLEDALLTTYTTSDPNNRVLADYLNGVTINGGTGKYENAKGQVFAFGAIDLSVGEITLRYSGTVCIKPPT